MDTLLDLTPGKWGLIAAPRALRPALLALVGRLAQNGPVCVLDGGNQFNTYQVARAVGGRRELLNRIQLARAFTCYQMLALLESTPVLASPFLVLDLLATFQDENVPLPERLRLLDQCILHLHRLSRLTFGLVSVCVPSGLELEQVPCMPALLQAASAVWKPEPASAPEAVALRLF